MTKFDEYSSLPEIFKKEHLSILSISRTEYMIGKFALYMAIAYDEKTDPLSVERINLESLDPENLYSESSALLFAFNSSLLRNALRTSELNFTLNGRMSSKEFSFSVSLKDAEGNDVGVRKIPISNAQIEIDAGFESEDKLYILEAKSHHVEDINLRQLYFPYRVWSKKVSKEVVPVFFIYTDSTFYIHVCKFEDPDNINSLRILSSSKYVVADDVMTMEDIDEIYNNVEPGVYSDVTFPQANSFGKIMDLLQLLNVNESMTKEEIAQHFMFDVRQSDYYANAAKFLGLVQKNMGVSSLTDLGKKIVKMPYRQKHKEIFSLILRDIVFYKSYEYIKLHSDSPPIPFVEELILKYHPPKKKADGDTPWRRAGSVASWLKWMVELTE